MTGAARSVLGGVAAGPVLAASEPLSFWGGVDPATARVIDVHHPLHGQCITGRVLVIPGSRGSCTGSGVLLDMVLSGRGPAALVFSEPEDVLTLGAMVADAMFGHALPVVRVPPRMLGALGSAARIALDETGLTVDGTSLPLEPPLTETLALSERDQAMLAGTYGEAAAQAMRILCAMAAAQGAQGLTDVTRAHIDGCIYASPANLTFAERMANLGGRVVVPSTMNAISVDRENWQAQGVPPQFGGPAQRLADAYVRMGCRPTFTCAPYLLEAPPAAGEAIGWAESNAVVYANSVLGARTAKHPDFLDLCIALTGRAPLSGVYLDAQRAPQVALDFEPPTDPEDAFWPLAGYLAGLAAPDRIPLLRGLGGLRPGPDDLKALCAAFGTTSAAPMLHIEGITPEARDPGALPQVAIPRAAQRSAWADLNGGDPVVDLVAIGSPHASEAECRALAGALGTGTAIIPVIVTAGRQVIAALAAGGTLDHLARAGVQVLPDLCWCSISEPVFPPATRNVMTSSGKYAHYGPGLSGRSVRLGAMTDCARAALTGQAAPRLPAWLE